MSVNLQMNGQAKLVLALVVMYVGFLAHFMLYEDLMPKKSDNTGGFNFPNALLFVFDLSCTITGMVAMIVMKASLPTSQIPFIKVVIPQQLGMLCSNMALQFVNYPTFQLLKSAKPMSVMACQLLIFRQPVAAKRIIVVIVLSAGLAIFGLGGKFEKSSYYGVLLAVGALFCDAVYVPLVDQASDVVGPFVTMTFVYLWSTLSVGTLRFSELISAAIWLQEHPEFIAKIALYGFSGGVATVALFTAIGLSGGLVVAIATTTRKFITIILSAIVFKHNLKPTQWVGVCVVFVALSIEMFFKTQGGKKKE